LTKSGTVVPPIVIATDEARRLKALANSNMTIFPREAFFLAREMNRANVVPDNADLRDVATWARKCVIATTRPAM